MINFLCEANTNAGTIVIYVILILVLVAMLIMPYFTQKKNKREFDRMLDSIRVGDLVKTAGGIIGKVTKITDKGEIKTVILETGSKTEKSYMEFDITMIYCVLKSTKPVQEDEESEKADETKAEAPKEEVEVVEDKEETQKTDEKAVETKKKSSTTKAGTKKSTETKTEKTPAKKTSAKK